MATQLNGLETDVQYLKGVGPRRAQLLRKLGIRTIRDLLLYMPRGYEDVSAIVPLASVRRGDRAVVAGQVVNIERLISRSGKQIVLILIGDSTGFLILKWFDFTQVADRFRPGQTIVCAGKVTEFNGRLQMVHPQIIAVDREAPSEPYLPIYSLTQDLRMQELRRIVRTALERYSHLLEETLPLWLRQKYGFPTVDQAVRELHFPPHPDVGERARRRFAYEELLLLQIAFAIQHYRMHRAARAPVIRVTEKIDYRIRRLFPFQLTEGQNRAIEDIVADLQSGRPMNRLVQGDVGSGKTVVATYALLAAIANHYQAALMAPTEVLARQHWGTLERYLAHSRVRRALLIGSRSPSERQEILEGIKAGEIDLVVGTHAIIQEDVLFRRLGVVVIDEQHKFGVRQRALIREKAPGNLEPHYLVMTATPIPRTLTLTVFGDLDVSIIRDLPPGRQPVTTEVVPPEKVDEVYEFVRQKIREGRQAYVICPLVEESDDLEGVAAAEQLQPELALEVFRDVRVGLVHGRMREEEKERTMEAFRAGDLDILVATSVVEVGVDVPNATVMVVLNATRFGLAQLHQLRGRIARGSHPGFCFLVAKPGSQVAAERLKVIASTTDGFRIAEEDLRLRGPGEFFGLRQHGLPELRFANLARDQELIQAARKDAFALVERDPQLRHPDLRQLRDQLLKKFGDRIELASVG